MNLDKQEILGPYFGEDVDCVRGFDPVYSWRLYSDDSGWTGINVNGPLDLICTPKDKKFMLSQTQASYDEKMNTAGERGKRVHEAAASSSPDPLKESEKSYFDVLQDYIHRHRVSNIASEFPVRDISFGYGGQCDRLGEFQSCNDTRCCDRHFSGLAVLDWKSGSTYRIIEGQQIAAYWHPVAKQYPKENVGMVIVRISPTTSRSFIYENKDFLFHKFLCALEEWKAVNFNKLRWLHAPIETRKLKDDERKANRVSWSELYQWQYLLKQGVVIAE